jgi:hypothetical protein
MRNHKATPACRPNRAWGGGQRTAGCALLRFPPAAVFLLSAFALSGCGNVAGYSTQSLFPDSIATVRLEMFDNRSFRRGVEFDFTDALAKRIEGDTPYKIVSDPDRADSVISGQLVSIGESTLSIERSTARPLEKEVVITAVVNWKDLRSGKMMINNQTVTAVASYSGFQNQDFTYASALAANRLAGKVVELMEQRW